MIALGQFIFESKEILTKSNKERKKELEKWLKHKKYDDYVDTLNKMLEDPKAKALLEDGFGGSLGDTKLNFSIKKIPVSQLMPTQKEIDLDKSLKHALTNRKSLYATFKNPIEINKPLVTFRQNYVIDGHHTWLQAITLNPNGRILSFNYDGEISPIQMLKAVQGTIAAVKAENGEKELPSNNVNGPNFFSDDFNKEKIKEYIKETLDEELIDSYKELIKECNDFDSTVNWITERLLDVKANNYPFEDAPNREDMPQIFKAGKDKDDKSTSYPDKDGSAMKKLKDDKFVKNATK